MKMFMFILTFFIFSFSNATTYYVSTTGNDATGTGTATNPWKTLYKATSTVTGAGNIIHINSGTYTETLQAVLAPGVSIEGDGKSVTILKSTITAMYTEMLNCRSALGTNGNQHISGVGFDGQSTTWALIRIGGRSNFSIYNCDFINARIHGVTFAANNTDDNDPGYPSSYCTGNSFHDNTMNNCGGWYSDAGTGFGNVQFGGQSGMLIYNNIITQNNTPHNNGWPIKYWQGGYNVGCKIYGNTLTSRLQDFTLGDQNWDFAIEMFNATGMEVYNNTIINGCVDFNNSSTAGFNTGGSFLVGGYGYSLWVHDNTFSCTTANTHVQTGVTLEFNIDSVIIEKNTFDKFNIGVLFTPRTGNSASNVSIRNNLLTDVTVGEGSEGYFVDCAVYSASNTSFKNINIYNNTFLANTSNPIQKGIMLPNTTGTGTLKNIRIKNNIIRGTVNSPIQVREGTVAIDSLDIQYNSIYNCGNNNLPTYTVAPTHYTFTNNLNVNPVFGTGYKLVTGTSLVDAGINVGLPFMGTAPDINWIDSTSAAPPVICNSVDGNRMGPGMTLINNSHTIRKAQYPDASALSTANSSSGKVCWKVIIDSLNPTILYNFSVGIANTNTILANLIGASNNEYALRQDGTMFHNGFFSGANLISYKQGDTLLLALDLSGAGSLKFYKKTIGATTWALMPQTFTSITAGSWFPSLGASQVGFKATIDLAPTDTIAGYSPICNGGPIVNVIPTANAGADQIITLPTTSVNLTGSGTDVDGTIASYQWTKVSGPTAGIITNATSAATSVTGLAQGVYKFELQVTDNSGAIGRDTMQVTVNPAANIPPTANAGADQSITLPINVVTLTGTGTDVDGTIASYQWTKISGPIAVIVTPGLATTLVTTLGQGVYKFELKVTDNNGATGTDTVQINVNAAGNVSPTANAGTDIAITLPTNSVTLNGSGNDPDGTIASYKWTKVSGPAAGSITTSTSASTSVTGLAQGVYLFELKVTDNSGATGTDTVQVTVNPAANVPPTANAGTDISITLPTNSVTLNGSGNDPDGTIASYKWTKVSGPAAGNITTSTSASTSVTGLAQGVYLFELKVTDNSGATGTDTVQVTVNPAANVPPTANAGTDIVITLPTNSVTLSGSGNDPDGTIASYKWTKVSGPAAGSITTSTSASTTVTGLAQGVYLFELKVTDNSGATGTDTVQVTVNPAANIPPTANAGSNISITLPTNSVTLSGSGNDPDGTITSYKWTKVSGPAAGTITTSTAASTTVTGLAQGVYLFELKVTDNSGATGTDTVQVTVNPAANIPPTANAGSDISITLPINFVTLNGSGNDPDGTIASYRWTKISGPAAGTITSPATAATSVTGLTVGVYQFQLTVTDNSGTTGTATVQVTVNPAPNVPPTANAGTDISITLPINFVTLNGSGNDPDGTIASYQWVRISGPSAGNITNTNSATTSVTGLIAGVYDYQLTVTDNSGATATDVVRVIVFAPNIPPTADAGLDQSITLPTNTASLTGSGTDVDGTIVSYRWTKISGPASGTIANANIAVTSVSGLAAGIYQFQLAVTDNNGATATDIMQVIVNAANIPPVANAGPDQTITLPVNSVTLNGSGTDVDGTIIAYRWKLLSGPADKLTNPNSAVTVLTDLIQGTYQFQLTVTDDKGATDADVVVVTVNAAVPPPTNNTAKIYPNPVVNYTTLEINNTTINSTVLITVTDVQGRVVYTKKLTLAGYNAKEKLDMSRFAKGAYFVTVNFDAQNRQTLQALKAN